MVSMKYDQHPEDADMRTLFIAIEHQVDPRMIGWLAASTPENSWGDQKHATEREEFLGDSQAVPGLLGPKSRGHVWRVRCAILQALDGIRDRGAFLRPRQVAK